ncbi:hypothetical protein ACIRPX_05180 [Streptomyces sp. NPDC101225]|uniref:hypothetical protein n=1 Tax=Streptomyces sp. NPDC101225 TaxID=3366135 RepID=UPI0038005D0A
MVPEVDFDTHGHGAYVVQAVQVTDEIPEDTAEALLLAGAVEAAVATTPTERSHAALMTLTGHATAAARILAAEYQAAGRNVFHGLDDALMSGGALSEVLEDAVRNVLRELAPRP